MQTCLSFISRDPSLSTLTASIEAQAPRKLAHNRCRNRTLIQELSKLSSPTDNISPCLFLSQNCPWLWLAVSEQMPLYYSILPLECTTPTRKKSKHLSPSNHCAYKQHSPSAWKELGPARLFEGLENSWNVAYIKSDPFTLIGLQNEVRGVG